MVHSGLMKTFKIVLITVSTLLFVGGAAFFLIGFLKPKPAGIYISTDPQSDVYINGTFSGKTPFQKTLDSGTIGLKLVPTDPQANLFPFETKLTLTSGIQTIVRREFGKNEDASGGDILSFESEGGRDAGMVVVSTPDNAQVSIDGVPRGFAPYKASSITPAEHQVIIKAPGYTDRIMTVSTKPGYRLTLFAKLAKSEDSPVLGATPSPTPAPLQFVLILNTPTGYLRVRTLPGTKGEEIGQVKPGDKFGYLDTDPDTGWLKIQFEEPQPGLPKGIIGWVSNQYAKLVDSSGKPVAAPTPTP